MTWQEAARDYDQELQGIRFTLVLLGIGADGHTASLFPHAPALREEARRAVAVPDRNPPRVTLTRPALAASDLVVFLAVGDDKAWAVASAFGGPQSEAVPASMVRSAAGRTVAVVDAAAATQLGASG
jgi:6-phosphogluconolactonase